MPILKYEAHAFNNRLGINGSHQLRVTWEEIVHAAITVGRSGRRDVLKHGHYSLFEMHYRCCLIYANLQTSHSDHIIKTCAYMDLDPSEKSAISYFLGLTFTKLLAARLFRIPWLMHLDVYKNQLSILTSGNRPDLVGQDGPGKWSVFEAKGRTRGKTSHVVAKAKGQTRGLRTICNCYPVNRVASIVHFPRQSLRVYLEDPDEIIDDAVDLNFSENQFHQDYYGLFATLFDPDREADRTASINRQVTVVPVAGNQRTVHIVAMEGIDVEIGLEAHVYNVLRSQNIRSQISEIMPLIQELLAQFDTENIQQRDIGPDESTDSGEEDSYLGPDGVFVRLGESWSSDRMRLDPRKRPG